MRDASGEYTLIRKIGRGGMGQVWAGVRRGLMMPVAIKVLHPDLAETERDCVRFENEARIAAQLDHGRIVKVIDTGVLSGCPFVVMEWVDGVNLRELVSKAREAGIPLSLAIICFIVAEVLAALQYAHNRKVAGHDAGVIHYDVTPGNVMITSSGEVKLTDWGIARFAATAGPLSRSVGTPRYMSPEQITGHPLRATDIYSLGVVLYELIEGAPYLDGADLDQFRARVLLGPPAELTQPDVPEWLRRLVRQMLAVRPDERPPASAARNVLMDNAPGYHAASRNLQSLYKSLVGEPRSGLTQMFELGELEPGDAVEQFGVAASLTPHGGDDVVRSTATLTGVPRRVAAVPEPLAIESQVESQVEPEIERTIELPMEDMLQPVPPRATLPMVMSRHAGQVRGSSPAAPVLAATRSETQVEIELARPADRPDAQGAGLSSATGVVAIHQRWSVVALTVMVLVLGTALAWTRFADRETNPAASPQPAVVADLSAASAIQPAPAPERVEEPAVDPPAVEPSLVEPPPVEPPPVEPSPVEPPPVEPAAIEQPPATPKPAPPTKAKAARQEVVFLARDGKSFELKIGEKIHQINLALKTSLRPGSYPIAWRRSASEDFRSCGTLVVEVLKDKQYYDIKVGEGTLSTDIRRRGDNP
jgi:serine/threonine protein kinase